MIKNFIDYLIIEFDTDRNITTSMVLTIFLFVFGIIVNQMLVLIKGFKERKHIRFFIKYNYKDLINDLTSNLKYLSELLEENLENPKKSHINIKITEFKELNVLNTLGYEKIYMAFMAGVENSSFNSKKKLTAVNELWKVIKNVTHQSEVLSKTIKGFYPEYRKKRNNLYNLYNEFMEFHNQLTLMITLNSGKNFGAYLEGLTKIEDNFNKIADYSIFQISQFLDDILEFKRNNLPSELFKIHSQDIIEWERKLFNFTIQYAELLDYISDLKIDVSNIKLNYDNSLSRLKLNSKTLFD